MHYRDQRRFCLSLPDHHNGPEPLVVPLPLAKFSSHVLGSGRILGNYCSGSVYGFFFKKKKKEKKCLWLHRPEVEYPSRSSRIQSGGRPRPPLLRCIHQGGWFLVTRARHRTGRERRFAQPAAAAMGTRERDASASPGGSCAFLQLRCAASLTHCVQRQPASVATLFPPFSAPRRGVWLQGIISSPSPPTPWSTVKCHASFRGYRWWCAPCGGWRKQLLPAAACRCRETGPVWMRCTKRARKKSPMHELLNEVYL